MARKKKTSDGDANPCYPAEGWEIQPKGWSKKIAAKHGVTPTPGPWDVYIIEESNGDCVRQGACIIATMPKTGEDVIVATLWEDERDEFVANARLIGAAPALLQAIKDAIPLIQGKDAERLQALVDSLEGKIIMRGAKTY